MRRRYVTGPTVIVGQEKEMSSVYGAEHLLRMLGTPVFNIVIGNVEADEKKTVSLPQMVASSTMDPESVALVRDYVNELMVYVFSHSSTFELRPHIYHHDFRWMVTERGRIFIGEYESASVAYQNISRS